MMGANLMEGAPRIRRPRGRPRKKNLDNESSDFVKKGPILAPPYKPDALAEISQENGEEYVPRIPPEVPPLVLGRKNKLNDILSSSRGAEDSRGIDRMGMGYTNKLALRRINSFEEDDGFVYQRSQEPDAVNEFQKQKKRPNELITRLQEEVNNISDGQFDEEVQLLDIVKPTVKRPRGRPKGTTKAKREKILAEAGKQAPGKKTNGTVGRPRKQIETSLVLSPPRSLQRPSRNIDNFSSDDYVEQVSHVKMNLARSEADDFGNKEEGRNANKRRISYNNRGKRVLSIGNGFVGVPHQDVPSEDYYKLLDTSLPEPHRMRQLLIWCFKRLLTQEERNNKNNISTTEDHTVFNIAKVIKEEVLQDLISGQVSTSWYDRDAKDGLRYDEIYSNKEITLPNPLNVTNQQNIVSFTEKLQLLTKEKADLQSSYDKAIKPLHTLHVNPNPSLAELQKYCQTQSDSSNSIPSLFIDNVMSEYRLGKMSSDVQDTVSMINGDVESSIDRLHNASYQMSLAHALIKSLKDRQLNPNVSSLVRDYVCKDSYVDQSSEAPDTTTTTTASAILHPWKIPSRSISTKQLLKGVTRLEVPRDISNDQVES